MAECSPVAVVGLVGLGLDRWQELLFLVRLVALVLPPLMRPLASPVTVAAPALTPPYEPPFSPLNPSVEHLYKELNKD